MRERFNVFGRLALFWLTFMVLIRICFLVYNYDQTLQLTGVEIMKTILYGLRMDASIIGYLLMIYGLLLTLSVFVQGKVISNSITIFTYLFLFASCAAVVVDVELYRHWGFRLNTTPFFYMGSEAAGTVEPKVAIKLLSILAVLFVGFILLFHKTITPSLSQLNPAKKRVAVFLFLVSALMFIPIRGGFSVATMNVGQVYFHKSNNFANHAAINVIWNFTNSLISEGNMLYPEDSFDKKLTEEYFSKLFPKNDSTLHMITGNKPNVILIIIESFTANVIEPLGGEKGVTPNLNALCKEGILFDNFYASGDRTDKGLVSILSAYPAQTQRSIIKYPGKTQKLSYLSRKLENLGYKTSMVYGGDANFANYRSFFTYAGFEHITSVEDFPSEHNNSKWGVHDQYLFEQTSSELDTTSTTNPFLKVVLTLSSHEPFDVPLVQYAGKDEASLFINSCMYTDKYLGEFISRCKQQPWWNNTLIVITADHGHRLPKNIDPRTKAKFKIPLLLLGGVVKKDTVIHTLGGQTDIANTLLGQLDNPSSDFIFSKDLFGNNVKDFAMYIFNDGFGYIEPDKYMIYDNQGKLYLREEGVTSKEDTYYGKAYLQKLYSDYNLKK